MKDINGHYSSSVLVIRVCLFELSFFLLSSRSTVSSPFFFFFFYRVYIYVAPAAIVDKRMRRVARQACSH